MFKSNKKIRILILTVFSVLLITLGAIGNETFAILHMYPEQAHFTKLPRVSPLDLNRLEQVMHYVEQYYYKPVSQKTLFDNAISGMLTKLDPHSDYLQKNDLKDLEMLTLGKFGGIGIEVMPDNGALKVVSPLDDTPASKAGIKSGDLIIKINKHLVKEMTLREAVNMMRGPKGSSLKLVILRKNETKPLTIKLIRDTIKIKSIKSKSLEPGYGYIRIAFFQNDTAKDLAKAITKLKTQNPKGLKGVILDLRNDPGGLLEAAIKVSDDFLDANKLKKNRYIVYTKGQFDGSEIYAKATPGELLPNIPLIVMINEGSASASEIVAGALKDHKRAIILGTRSFGKGSVQTLLPLDKESAIKITTALYYTPSGRSIQAMGIEPNVTVNDLEIPKLNKNDKDDFRIDESNLMDHIKATESNAKNLKKQLLNDAKMQKLGMNLAHKDYQLYEALNIMKGLSAYRQIRK